MEDTSLDEFLDSGEESTAESESDEEGTEPSSSPETDDQQVEQATVTARWRSDESRCYCCGDAVSRLWVDDNESVCRACKEW